MTRDEHIKWCKERAIQEFDYYLKSGGLAEASRNGLTSMMSDLHKNGQGQAQSVLDSLIMMKMMDNSIRSRRDFVKFIDGFN